MNDTNFPIERFRLSQNAKDRLVLLKRRTGIRQWNVICRWAFCRSLAEESVPTESSASPDSNVEMSWRVFGGSESDTYAAILRYRCIVDGFGTDRATLVHQFRLHLHRGIDYLATECKRDGLLDLVRLGLDPPRPRGHDLRKVDDVEDP